MCTKTETNSTNNADSCERDVGMILFYFIPKICQPAEQWHFVFPCSLSLLGAVITLSNIFGLACLMPDQGKICNKFRNPIYKFPFIQTAMFHGDVNLSCTMTFLSTLGSFAFTSLWVYLLGRQVLVRSSTRVNDALFTYVNHSLALWRLDWSPYHNIISLLRPMIGKDIPIPYMNIAMSLVSFTVPLLLGVAFKHKWPKKALVLSKKVPWSINISINCIWQCQSLSFPIFWSKGFSTILLCGSHHPSLHRYLVKSLRIYVF